MSDTEFLAMNSFVAKRFRRSLFRALLELSRRYQALMMWQLNEGKGHTQLKLAFQALIRAIPQQGIRPTDLADKLGMQKQNCSTLVKQIENAGYLLRTSDPEDKRAQNIVLSEWGHQLVNDGLAVTTEIDDAIRETIGDKKLSFIIACLRRLLEAEQLIDTSFIDNSSPAVLVAMLITAAEYSGKELYDLLRKDGHTAIRPAHGQVIMFIQQGARIQEIANYNDVSKQAIAKAVAEMESLGFLTLTTDINDKRGKVISVAPGGEALIESSVKAAGVMSQHFMDILGETTYIEFEATMMLLHNNFFRVENAIKAAHPNESLRSIPFFSDIEHDKKLQALVATLHMLEQNEIERSKLLTTCDQHHGEPAFRLSDRALNLLANIRLTKEECEVVLQAYD